MHTTTPVDYEFAESRKRKLEPQSVRTTAPPVRPAHGGDNQVMTVKPQTATNLRPGVTNAGTENITKNVWGPMFQNREHFVDLHIC